VTPEQSAPTIAATPSEVIIRSAAAVAAPASMQVESARTDATVAPPKSLPLSETSFIASSAPSAIGGVRLSIGPVNPNRIPSLISPAEAPEAISADTALARSSFFIVFSQLDLFFRAPP